MDTENIQQDTLVRLQQLKTDISLLKQYIYLLKNKQAAQSSESLNPTEQ